MAENIMIQNGGAGIGKPMGSPKFDDFLNNFRIPAKYLNSFALRKPNPIKLKVFNPTMYGL